jgi:hypothetical protein
MAVRLDRSRRHRVGWDQLCDLRLPLLSAKGQKAIGDYYRKAEEHEAKITELRASAVAELASLQLEGETPLTGSHAPSRRNKGQQIKMIFSVR